MEELPPHVQRMIAESDELNERAEKLAAFIAGPGPFADLDEVDRDLLVSQHAAMDCYASVLSARIRRARP